MKTDILKKFIKESVKEAIQEELKDILLEAIRSPKTVVQESMKDTYAQPHIEKPKQLTPQERKAMFGNLLGEMQNGGVANTNSIPFNASGPVDPINGSLPEGNVGLDQIMALMNKK
jgi:hypothetical protein